MKQLKITSEGIGVKLCHECEKNIRCNDCVYNKQGIEHWQKEAVEKFADKLLEECSNHKEYKIDLVALNHIVELIKK